MRYTSKIRYTFCFIKYKNHHESSRILMAMKQRGKVIAGIIAGFAVVLLIIWMSPVGKFILSGGLGMEEQKFDASQWRAVETEDFSKKRIRLMMSDDLTENILPGMDSSGVKQLLGEPERKYGFTYNVGSFAPNMDPLFLILTFDANGKVSKTDVEIEGELKEEKSDKNH